MAKMAELHAELTEIPDEAKSYVEGFYRGHEEGVELERERIINLLENQHNYDQIFVDAVSQILALIKGENK